MELKKPRDSKMKQSGELNELGEENISSVQAINQQQLTLFNQSSQQIGNYQEASQTVFNKLRRNKIEEKRVFIMDEHMKEQIPVVFEADRGDGEKFKVLYAKTCDKFFQLQECLNECSLFIGKAISKGKVTRLAQPILAETRVFPVTEIDPMFFLLNALSLRKRCYQTLDQILDQAILESEDDSPTDIAFQANDCAMNETSTVSSSHGMDLKTLLMCSARVRRSLTRICLVKTLNLDQGEHLVTYCYDEEMLLSLMIEKHNKIKGFLAQRYINEHKGDQEDSSRKIIKQEIKREVKTEVKKEESSQNTAQIKSEGVQQNSVMYENMFRTVAAGFVADELPKSLVEKFLARIESSKSLVYSTFGNQEGSVSHEGDHIQTMPGQVDKKRSQAELPTSEKKDTQVPLNKKQAPQTQQQKPKGPMYKFFNKKEPAK